MSNLARDRLPISCALITLIANPLCLGHVFGATFSSFLV